MKSVSSIRQKFEQNGHSKTKSDVPAIPVNGAVNPVNIVKTASPPLPPLPVAVKPKTPPLSATKAVVVTPPSSPVPPARPPKPKIVISPALLSANATKSATPSPTASPLLLSASSLTVSPSSQPLTPSTSMSPLHSLSGLSPTVSPNPSPRLGERSLMDTKYVKEQQQTRSILLNQSNNKKSCLKKAGPKKNLPVLIREDLTTHLKQTEHGLDVVIQNRTRPAVFSFKDCRLDEIPLDERAEELFKIVKNQVTLQHQAIALQDEEVRDECMRLILPKVPESPSHQCAPKGEAGDKVNPVGQIVSELRLFVPAYIFVSKTENDKKAQIESTKKLLAEKAAARRYKHIAATAAPK